MVSASIAVIAGLWLVVELAAGNLGGATLAFATLLLVFADVVGARR